jgi:3alpha(or 20beta)-hydroxysteroid dehydrogenase
MALKGLDGRVVIVTGGASGLGLATARRLLTEGACVAVLDISGAHAAREELADERVFAGSLDVALEPEVAAAFEQVRAHFGRLDALFNNAGVGSVAKPVVETELADLERMLRVNVGGAFLCLREMMRIALRLGSRAAIVNAASATGLRGAPNLSAYSSTKAALIALTRAAALEGAADGVRVNAILPGPIDTPMTAHIPEDVRARVTARVPLGRFGDPEEVAALVAWLLSDEATYVTGALYSIDGGETA